MLAYTVITLHIHIFFDMNNNLEAMPVFIRRLRAEII